MFLDKLLSIFGPHIIVLQGLPHILYMGAGTYIRRYVFTYVNMHVLYMSTYYTYVRILGCRHNLVL